MLVKAPHSPENVPRTCWTCLHKLCADTMTVCQHIKTYNHTKLGIEPCERYDLDAIWLVVDWFYPEPKKKRMGR